MRVLRFCCAGASGAKCTSLVTVCHCNMNDLECDRQLAFLLLLSVSMNLDVFFEYYSFLLLAFSLALGFSIPYLCAFAKKKRRTEGGPVHPKHDDRAMLQWRSNMEVHSV